MKGEEARGIELGVGVNYYDYIKVCSEKKSFHGVSIKAVETFFFGGMGLKKISDSLS